MRKIMFLIFLILVSIFDCQLLINLGIYKTISYAKFLITHVILFSIIYFYYKFKLKEKVNIPFYLALFLPGFGFIFITSLYIFTAFFRKNEDLIKDYEKYIKYINEMIIAKDIDLEKELDVSAALDNLYVASDKKKKNVIIDLISDDIDLKVNILKKALNDDDPEVVHYASSTLNLIEREYEKKIKDLRNNYITRKDRETLKELLEVYDEYVKGGFYSNDLLQIQMKEYLGVIDEYIKRFGKDYEILSKKIDVLIELKEYDKVQVFLKDMYKDYPERIENYIFTLKILFYTGKYKEMKNVARRIKSTGKEIPEKYSQLVEYWS